MFVASGPKVWPCEVEEAILKFPNVLEAAVMGFPDDYRGQNVKAFVAMSRRAVGTGLDELREHCCRELAGYKVPRLFEVLEELPKNTNGKIQHV